MKVSKKLLIMAALVGAVGLQANQADAAKDYLRMEAPVLAAPLTQTQEAVTVQAPNEEVKEVLDDYIKFSLDQSNKKYVKQTNQVVAGQQLDVENFLFYMRVRFNFYKESHRWKSYSYGTKKLGQLYSDFRNYFEANTYVTEANAERMKADLLEILRHNAEDVNNSELRTYMNEAFIFAMRETMLENNPTVQPYKDKKVEMPKEHKVQLLKGM